ncbi:MAG TPA: HD domain-containing phosphohydrolase [Thermoanaerobaculia bacterium]|nr:HD domain-containing phosphohydrolase [Thermoanaerobaculia bacterium]
MSSARAPGEPTTGTGLASGNDSEGDAPGGRGATPPPGEGTLRGTLEELGLRGGEGTPDLAHSLFSAWFQLFRTAQIHAVDNQATQRAVARFVAAANRVVTREGYASFQARDQLLFLNQVKVKLTTEEFELASEVFAFFRDRGMGGFVVEATLDAEAVRSLLGVLIYAPPGERGVERAKARLRQMAVPVRVNRTLGARRHADVGVALERRLYTFATWSKLVVLYRGLLTDDGHHEMRRRFLVRKITRTIQALVDICLEDDHTFLGLSAVKQAEAYEPQHAANVAVLAIALGDKVGLPKVELADLGLAGLFHDIGMRVAPRALTDKPAALSAEERARVERHPLAGVEFLLAEPSFGKSVLRRIAVTFEHHCGVDGGGYPRLLRPPHLFSRIVSIAAAYDALTTARPWRKAFLPDEALAIMLGEAGKRFDGALLKVFVNNLGLYPVGTLVRLTGGELAVVVYSGTEAERASRPMVALLGADGKPRKLVDLAERDAEGGYRRSIVTSEDPTRYGLSPAALLALAPTR